MVEDIERFKNESRRLESDYKKEKERLESRAQQNSRNGPGLLSKIGGAMNDLLS